MTLNHDTPTPRLDENRGLSRLLLGLVVAACAIAAAREARAQPTSISLGDGVVVVPAARRVYVMDPKEGVVALDLATGQLRWKTGTRAAKPLVQLGESLVALDEKGALRVLAAKTGKLARGCNLIKDFGLPLLDTLGSRASSHGVGDATHAWVVAHRSTHYAGGAARPPEELAAARSESRGVYELDLSACSARPVDTHPYFPTLKPGGPLDTMVLPHKEGSAALQTVTGDGRHVVASDGAYVPHDGYASVVIDVETGKQVFAGMLAPFPQAAVVVDRFLVGGAGLAWVHDMPSGKRLWTRGVRDTGYHGPYPPSAAPGGRVR